MRTKLLAPLLTLMLILAACGNVLAMFAISTFVLLCGILLFSRDDEICRADGLVALIGAGTAIAVSAVMMIRNLL